jgi:leader peptidase (prepilin peptidase)/N-methyltransferase
VTLPALSFALTPLTLAALVLSPFAGSLAALVGQRLPQGRPVVIARSACDHCGATLGPFELIPLVSFAVQRGRCRHCGGRIPILLPLAELAAIVVAASAAFAFYGWSVWIACALGWTLIALTVSDVTALRLPDVLTLPLAAAGLLASYRTGMVTFIDGAVGAVIAFGLFAALGFIYRRWRGRIGLGFGDAKLMGAAGAWVGVSGVPSVMLIGAGGALLAVLATVAITRQPWPRQRRIAFAPWLCLAIWWVYVVGPLKLVLF